MGKEKSAEEQDLEQKTGMERQHLIAIAETAIANNTAMIFRPVNDSVRTKFAAGAVGKGMDVKGKSADQGQEIGLDGFIPVDQELSKLGSKGDFASIELYQEKNNTKIKGDADRYQKITETDIGSLSAAERIKFEESLKNLVETTPLKDKDGNKIVFFKDSSGHALKGEDGKFVFAAQTPEGALYKPNTKEPFAPPEGAQQHPVEVLAYRELSIENNQLVQKESKPITADYDQLAVFTKAENKGQAVGLEDKPYAGFATETGHTVTTALAGDTADKLAVSHGQETGNPVPEKITNDKYTVFDPTPELRTHCSELSEQIRTANSGEEKTKLNQQLDEALLKSVRVISTEKGLIEFYNVKEAQGYQAPVNDAWGWRRNDKQQYEIDPDRVLAQDLYIETHNLLDNEELKQQHPSMESSIAGMSATYKKLGQAKLEPYSVDSQSKIRDLEIQLKSQIDEFQEQTSLSAPIEATRAKAGLPPFKVTTELANPAQTQAPTAPTQEQAAPVQNPPEPTQKQTPQKKTSKQMIAKATTRLRQNLQATGDKVAQKMANKLGAISTKKDVTKARGDKSTAAELKEIQEIFEKNANAAGKVTQTTNPMHAARINANKGKTGGRG